MPVHLTAGDIFWSKPMVNYFPEKYISYMANNDVKIKALVLPSTTIYAAEIITYNCPGPTKMLIVCLVQRGCREWRTNTPEENEFEIPMA